MKIALLVLAVLLMGACVSSDSELEDRLTAVESDLSRLTFDAQHFVTEGDVDRRLSDLEESVETMNSDLSNLEWYTVSDLETDVDQIETDLLALAAALCRSPNLDLRC